MRRNDTPFGMALPNRQFNSGEYRFGFNGKENDSEVKGTGNQQDYGMRIYDTRLGKFLSVDPLAKSYAWNSPFAFAENDVIRSIDLDGLEKAFRYITPNDDGTHSIAKVISYKTLFPGQENGNKGTGTLDFYYDNKVKKFGEGQYVKSYKDEHPIRNFLQEGDKRYESEKGFSNLAGDMGTGAKIVGGVVALIAPPLGATIYEAGSYLSDAADINEIAIDIKNGNTKDVVITLGANLTGRAGGALVDKTVTDESKKLAGKMAVDVITDKVKEKTKESTKTGEKK